MYKEIKFKDCCCNNYGYGFEVCNYCSEQYCTDNEESIEEEEETETDIEQW
jgi:hypothetical protein